MTRLSNIIFWLVILTIAFKIFISGKNKINCRHATSMIANEPIIASCISSSNALEHNAIEKFRKANLAIVHCNCCFESNLILSTSTFFLKSGTPNTASRTLLTQVQAIDWFTVNYTNPQTICSSRSSVILRYNERSMRDS